MKRTLIKLLLMVFVLTATTASSQSAEKNPKDLWSNSVDVTLGDNWRQKTIVVPGKGTPNVVDFFRAFAKAYPCEYHDLLLKAIDGDQEVQFGHKKPRIDIDKDSCYLEHESFAMRVFYENGKIIALGVCCHKSITTELQEAYYYRYNSTSRKLTPHAQGSDFTGGILKRHTSFNYDKNYTEISMSHSWGRCGVKNYLVWENGKLVLMDLTKKPFKIYKDNNIAMAVLDAFLQLNEMELRDPKPASDLPGSSYTSLPVCIAIRDTRSGGSFAAASAMEGFYYFYARGWEKADGTSLVAVYMECASRFDYDFDPEKDGMVKTPHKLCAGDEVGLQFYVCDSTGMATYIAPTSPLFAKTVGKGMPSLEQNEWRCLLDPDNEDLIFVSEKDGQRKTFKWDGKTLSL